MKKIITGLLFIVVLIFNFKTNAFSVELSDLLLHNNNLGYEYWIAVPQNDVTNSGLRQEGLEIMCTPIRNTTITMEVPEVGILKSKAAEAFKTTTFSTIKGDFGWTMEVTESEIVSKKGIRLSASEPFTVYFITSKQYSSDGYMAIPVEAWDKKYYHCAYWDFYINSGDDRNKYRGGGFIVIASEDGTNVTINLDGEGKGYAKTAGGKDIGEVITVTLNRGQTYMVKGDGKTRGVFDISGTSITATKPVGVVSFHLRTMIPSVAPEDRDNICEMIPPVTSLGKKYATVQFNRTPRGSAKGVGDLFRVVATEDNTKIHCDYFDIQTLKKIGQKDITLNKAGDWVELEDIKDIANNNTKLSIRGISYWEGDKPFLLIQNSFSSPWDNDSKWTPISVVVPPVEQYFQSINFQTPDQTDFNENEITIVAIGDASDPEYTLLKTIVLDGEEIWRKNPQIFGNRIEGTNLYWARMKVAAGPHLIQSKTKLSGYLVGFSSYNAYGYPLGMTYNHVYSEFDTVAPKFTLTNNCGNYTVEATELTVGKPSDNPKQSDVGISRIIFFKEQSFNYDFSIQNPDNFKPQLKITRQKFDLKLIDPTIPATAVFGLLDHCGNYRVDSVVYKPENIAFSHSTMDFGNVRVKNSKEIEFEITNNSTQAQTIKSITNKNPLFVISPINLPANIDAGGKLKVKITYTPTVKTTVFANIDTFRVETNCVQYKFVLTGRAIIPDIAVAPFNFGEIFTGTKKCIEEINNLGLQIENTGTDVLKVTAVENVKPPFLLSSPTVPDLPFEIAVGEKVYLKSICFVPSDSVEYKVDVLIKSDAESGDKTIAISGKGKVRDESIVIQNSYSDIDLKIYPNPVNSNNLGINFNLNYPSLVKIELYSIEGSNLGVIFSGFVEQGAKSISHSLNGIGQGSYYVKLTSGTTVKIERFIKITN